MLLRPVSLILRLTLKTISIDPIFDNYQTHKFTEKHFRKWFYIETNTATSHKVISTENGVVHYGGEFYSDDD